MTTTFFPVYARADSERVQHVIDALKGVGIEVWTEAEGLQPGTMWPKEIAEAIETAAAALVFISPALSESRHAHNELALFGQLGKPILPLVLVSAPNLPLDMKLLLASFQEIDLTKHGNRIPQKVLEGIRDYVARARPDQSTLTGDAAFENLREVATTLASTVRKGRPAQEETTTPPTSVFIVHGHDDSLLRQVEGHLTTLGVGSVVLRRIGGPAQSLFQKFMQWGTDTRFALVLLSADDLGVSREQYETEGVGLHTLQFRARQNVILELGFFYGHLGWENVFVLFKKASKVFPNFERPSDLDGVVFDMIDESGQWKGYLEQKLKDAGFSIGRGPNQAMRLTRNEDARK